MYPVETATPSVIATTPIFVCEPIYVIPEDSSNALNASLMNWVNRMDEVCLQGELYTVDMVCADCFAEEYDTTQQTAWVIAKDVLEATRIAKTTFDGWCVEFIKKGLRSNVVVDQFEDEF